LTSAVTAAAAAVAEKAGDVDAEDESWLNCDNLLNKQLSLHDDVCDSWFPQFNSTQLRTLCRSADTIQLTRCRLTIELINKKHSYRLETGSDGQLTKI